MTATGRTGTARAHALTMATPAPRWAALVVLGLIGIGILAYSAANWQLADVDAYWNAATRLREGQPLYIQHPDSNAAEVYRYAPWFAVAWIPLTYLPRGLVEVAWAAVLVSASLAVILPLLRERTPAAIAVASLFGSLLILGASYGNVQPLMIAALAFGVDRRSGPVWIALAASLKATPILYVLVYAGRREWTKVIITLALGAVLVFPMAIIGADYSTEPGWSHSLYSTSVMLYVAVAVASIVMAVLAAWRQPSLAWLAASAAVILTLPRYFSYELTYLLVGALPSRRRIDTTPG